ncbi:MAG: hypothetical protein H0T42_06955 [Deltaproteobacteria bacterium]|nr:hypothetical protein [Deltaproteobacteria bacterium]
MVAAHASSVSSPPVSSSASVTFSGSAFAAARIEVHDSSGSGWLVGGAGAGLTGVDAAAGFAAHGSRVETVAGELDGVDDRAGYAGMPADVRSRGIGGGAVAGFIRPGVVGGAEVGRGRVGALDTPVPPRTGVENENGFGSSATRGFATDGMARCGRAGPGPAGGSGGAGWTAAVSVVVWSPIRSSSSSSSSSSSPGGRVGTA